MWYGMVWDVGFVQRLICFCLNWLVLDLCILTGNSTTHPSYVFLPPVSTSILLVLAVHASSVSPVAKLKVYFFSSSPA